MSGEIIISNTREAQTMNSFNEAAALLPMRVYSELLVLPDKLRESAEEIRLRSGQYIQLDCGAEITELDGMGRVGSELIDAVMERASEASVHAVESCIAKGYMSIRGGIRLGICGTAVMRSGAVCGLREISSLALRIPHEINDCASEAFSRLYSNKLDSVLIVSPPGFGKTTCLRNYIRLLSDSGVRVSLADERGELAAVYKGQAQFDVGKNTDIISLAPKADAAVMLLKAMNPQLIAMDEVSSEEDMKAIEAVSGCGVKLLASVHAESLEELISRPLYRNMLRKKLFRYALMISRNGADRQYEIEDMQ